MGNGCLKPQPRIGQVYIDCINSIYEEVKQMQDFQIKKDQEIYDRIKSKLQKKGWLMKLMDYLTSHRSSISQAALHNFRLMAQNKGLHFKVTGLVVIDYIIAVILRQSGLEIAQKISDMVHKMTMKQNDINAETFYQQYENKRQAIPTNRIKSGLNIQYAIPSVHCIQSCSQNNNSLPLQPYFNINTSNLNNQSFLNPNSNQNNCLMLRQIYNVKFSNIFFNMVHSLISTEDDIYTFGVRSIIIYTKFHTVKNIQQQKILDILQILLQYVETGDQVTLSLKAYEMLIQKIRESFLEKQVKRLKIFLKIWEESFIKSYDQQNQASQVSVQNRFLIEKIIQKMITSMIGSMAVNKIYEQIIYVYDEHKFQNMTHFQEMLITITNKNQLKNQFFRGLYSFLLSYLAVCRGNSTKESTKSIESLKKANWLTLINKKWPYINANKSYQNFVNEYQNIQDLRVKKSAVQTLKRWTKSYQFVEINQIIKYNSSLFLNSFLLNIHESFVSEDSRSNTKSQDKDILSHNAGRFFMNNFCFTFCHQAQIQQRIGLVNQLFDQIKTDQIVDQQKLIYMQMIRKLMHQQQIQSQKTIILCQVDSQYNTLINIELIAQTSTLIGKLSQRMLIKQIQQIAYFFYSVFDVMSRASLSYHDSINFGEEAIKLLQTTERYNGSLVVLSFIERVVKAVSNQMDKQNLFICWDLVLNCTYALLGSPRNKSRQKTKKQLNETYIKITQIQQLKALVNKIKQAQFDQRVHKLLQDNFGLLFQDQQELNLLGIELPQPEDFQTKTSTQNQKTYELSSIAFRDIFSRGVSIVKGGFFNINQEDALSFQSQTDGFGRQNSIIRQQELKNQQRSISDIMDMINI